jgi:hypothetical protein
MERVEGLECRFFPLRPMHSLYVRVLALLSTKLHAAVAAGNGWLRRRRFRPKARLMTLVPIQRSIAPIACTTMHGGTDASLNLLSCVTFSQPESLNLACSCFIEYLSNVSLLVNWLHLTKSSKIYILMILHIFLLEVWGNALLLKNSEKARVLLKLNSVPHTRDCI